MTLEARDDSLPAVLPVFPLPGAVMLAGGKLPLNIFEPRYLAMIKDAMKGDRLIGMIQPRENGGERPALFDVGCVGRITSYSETDDGRYLITLTGICRFRVIEEMDTTTPYRIIAPDYAPYVADRAESDTADAVEREGLLGTLKRYLERRGLGADWDAIGTAPTDILINSLAMICPFTVAEKQALLEAMTLAERADTMVALMEFAIAEGESDEDDPAPAPGLN